jgi:ADP-heptose:LPS heptosyltransferase
MRRLLGAAKRVVRFRLLTALDHLEHVADSEGGGERGDTLVIRTNRLGDFILWLDAAKEIRRIPGLPGRLVLLTTRPSDELRDELAAFDEVWSFDLTRMRSDLGYRRRLLRRIAKHRFSAVLNTVLSRDPLVDDAIVRASGAPRRIGVAGDLSIAKAWEQRCTDGWYTELYPAPSRALMELQRLQRYFSLLGAAYDCAVPKLRGVYARPTGLTANPYYVMAPGASWSGKTWPVERFKEIARRTHEKTGWAGVACGGRDEMSVTAALCAGDMPPLHDSGGRTTLHELIGLIAHASLVVCNDTSVAHIAAAVRAPSVVVVGGGHFGRFLPYRVDHATSDVPSVVHAAMPCFGCDWVCCFAPIDNGPKPCITEVSVERVWSAIEALLRARRFAAAGERE